MEEIRSLVHVGMPELFAAWDEAFKDYGMPLTMPDLEKMLQRRGYNPLLSYGAFDGSRLVSFTLNCIGEYEGKRTAYDTSSGTFEAYRGRGLASRILEASFPVLRQNGIEQYLLEVLQNNTKALSVYTKLGCTVSRELNYFVCAMNTINIGHKPIAEIIELKETGLQKEAMAAMWDFAPSWQNSFDSIERCLNDFKIFGAFQNDVLVGYGIVNPSNGDIPQIAVHKQHRRKGIGTALLKVLLVSNNHTVVKVINADATYNAITAFFEKNGIAKAGMQFEMIRSL